jgi:hypothetical protein
MVICIVLFVTVFGSLLSTGVCIEKSNFKNQSSETDSFLINTTNFQKSKIIIKDIKDGVGLTLTLYNEGDNDSQNIQLNVEATGGLITILPKKIYPIPFLSAGATTDIHIAMFGLGLGKFTDFPNVTMKVSGPDIDTAEKRIAIKILGPFIRITTIYPENNVSFNGYTLFSPEYSRITYLIDNNGSIVHQWNSNYIQGLGVYLLENGNLLRTNFLGITPPFVGGGLTGRVEIFDWNNTLLWGFNYEAEYQYCLHHDVEMLPNGNILMIAWEYKPAADAIAAGRNPSTLSSGQLWPDHIIEVKPTGSDSGDIVWEWHVWDHLIQDYDSSKANYGTVADHPELFDINYLGLGGFGADWTHINSIDYNEKFDQILLSVRNFGEVLVIDHSTTSEEAAGHTGGNGGKGGDLLYRWGNPRTYRAGDASDQKFFGQHDAAWIDERCPGAGNILVFNNGVERQGDDYSSVDEIVPPVDTQGIYAYTPGFSYEPDQQLWMYTADNPTEFMSDYISGAQRLPNGNTLICNGANGILFEVTTGKKIVWLYMNVYPGENQNQVGTALRYAPDYPGLKL